MKGGGKKNSRQAFLFLSIIKTLKLGLRKPYTQCKESRKWPHIPTTSEVVLSFEKRKKKRERKRESQREREFVATYLLVYYFKSSICLKKNIHHRAGKDCARHRLSFPPSRGKKTTRRTKKKNATIRIILRRLNPFQSILHP